MTPPQLPPLAQLSEAERRWLGMRFHRLRELRGMTLGTFAEAVVAEALPGSREDVNGTASVDISWQPTLGKSPIGVEVKHSRGGSWNVGESYARQEGARVRRRRADVYVLASHEGPDHRAGWTFFVLPCWRLNDWARATLSLSRLHRWRLTAIAAGDLPAAVRAAANAPRNSDEVIQGNPSQRRGRRSRPDIR